MRLAYATVGQGPPLVKAANWLNHLEFDWDSPVWRHLFRGLAKDRQLIRYDERGNGLSDWDAEFSFEMFVRDLETVVDTIGLDRFPLLGISQGCAVSVAYAVRHPERVSHLILYGGYARGSNHRGDPGNVAVRQALKTLVLEGWGRENPNFRQIFTSFFIPGGTHEQMRWFNDLQRMTTSPENAVRFLDTFDDINVTDLLDRVTMPTLVLHCRDDARVSFAEGRLLATSIPGARFVSLDGRNHLILEDEPAFPRFMEEVRNFLAVDSPPARATPSPALAPAGVSDQPSIAVLPFDNMSGDSEQDYFVDGMTEDITTALSRVRWLFVIARHSSFAYKGSTAGPQRVAGELGVRYLLGGSLRRADNRVRITAELIEGATGEHLWAKRFDREVGDIFALQDEVAAAIVGEMEPEMGKAERFRARAKTPGNLDAWDLCQRGLAHLYRYTKDDVEAARQLFRRARDMDPELVAAWCGLAEACYYAIVYGLTDSPDERREEALAAARRAVGLDHEDAAAHCALGRVHYLRREHEAAVPELETAIELNPSLALAHYGLGAALVFAGRAAQERPHVETAIKLSPHDPNMGSFLVRLADACLFLGQHEDALGWARKALRQPGFQWSRHAALIAALGHLGRATPMATRRTATRRRAKGDTQNGDTQNGDTQKGDTQKGDTQKGGTHKRGGTYHPDGGPRSDAGPPEPSPQFSPRYFSPRFPGVSVEPGWVPFTTMRRNLLVASPPAPLASSRPWSRVAQQAGAVARAEPAPSTGRTTVASRRNGVHCRRRGAWPTAVPCESTNPRRRPSRTWASSPRRTPIPCFGLTPTGWFSTPTRRPRR